MWVITLAPTLGAGGALEKGHPLLYLDVPSASKVPTVCLSRETVCGTARSEKEGSSRSRGVDMSTNSTHSCLSYPDRLHSPSFGRSAPTLCRPVPVGEAEFPDIASLCTRKSPGKSVYPGCFRAAQNPGSGEGRQRMQPSRHQGRWAVWQPVWLVESRGPQGPRCGP